MFGACLFLRETVPEGLQTDPRLTIPFLTPARTNGGREGAYGDHTVPICRTPILRVMTLTEDAQTTFADLGLDRDDALLAAKSMGQTIIEESQSTDTPLESMVYEVWGLYDDGMPACQFAVPDGDGDIVFNGQFRTGGETPFVERRRTISADALKALVEEAASPDLP